MARSRQTSEERREQVLEAALAEFAELGYRTASTAAIARRAGISQPYIYALFTNKKELFLAVHDFVVDRIWHAFAGAARGATDSEDALHRMGSAYTTLVHDRYHLLFQLQAYAAAGDAEIGEQVARRFKALVDDVRRLSGATAEEITTFFACGMLINVATSLDLPEILEPALDSVQPRAA